MVTVDIELSADPLRILVVSTGDVCRAPAAARLLTQGLLQRLDGVGRIALASAGTQAPVGCDLHPLTAEVLRRRGLPVAGHLASELGEVAVAEADLILGAERRHRLAVVQLCPEAAGRTFTLRELARGVRSMPAEDGLCASGPADRALGQLLARRDLWQPEHPADDDIPDPVTGDLAVHERVVAQLAAVIHECAGVLAGLAMARHHVVGTVSHHAHWAGMV